MTDKEINTISNQLADRVGKSDAEWLKYLDGVFKKEGCYEQFKSDRKALLKRAKGAKFGIGHFAKRYSLASDDTGSAILDSKRCVSAYCLKKSIMELKYLLNEFNISKEEMYR